MTPTKTGRQALLGEDSTGDGFEATLLATTTIANHHNYFMTPVTRNQLEHKTNMETAGAGFEAVPEPTTTKDQWGAIIRWVAVLVLDESCFVLF